MAFDFKKEYKEFYMPKNKPEILNVTVKVVLPVLSRKQVVPIMKN